MYEDHLMPVNIALTCLYLGSPTWKVRKVAHFVGRRLILNLELCFWLFLVNSGSSQQNWFQSLYFKAWILGSAIAVIYMPLVTIFTRSDPLKVCPISFFFVSFIF